MVVAQKAYTAKISLSFNYKPTENAKVEVTELLPARISYLMIEHLYDNANILPVIYLSLNISSKMYTKIVNYNQTSTFSLRITKQNKFSKNAIEELVVNDIFSYVPSTTTANYTEKMDKAGADTYKSIMVGLVSSTMTNKLRVSFNGVYKNKSVLDMVNIGLKGLTNLVAEPVKYDAIFDQILITPCSTRYAFINQVFKNYPFYDTNFTMYMDFDKTYFLSRTAKPIPAGDNKPTTMVINIKDITQPGSLENGYSITNGSYILTVNAIDTEVKVDNATEKMINSVIAFSDSNETQNLSIDINPTILGSESEKTTYLRTLNAALVKNEMQSNAVTISILKQNVDSSIFNPNISYTINNFKDYSKYDGKYYLYYKREIYSQNANDFVITCNVGFKRAGTEELAMSTKDTTKKNKIITSAKTSSSATKMSRNRRNTSKVVKASRKTNSNK